MKNYVHIFPVAIQLFFPQNILNWIIAFFVGESANEISSNKSKPFNRFVVIGMATRLHPLGFHT